MQFTNYELAGDNPNWLPQPSGCELSKIWRDFEIPRYLRVRVLAHLERLIERLGAQSLTSGGKRFLFPRNHADG
jgi:hypothetical protein